MHQDIGDTHRFGPSLGVVSPRRPTVSRHGQCRVVRGDEIRVIEAFCAYLAANGWAVEREVAFCDVVARRAGVTMYCEAKGRTASIGLDVDTMYGQLLRRMMDDPAPGDRYGLVVPDQAETAVLRVPTRVRDVLGIEVFVVGADGAVRAV